MEALLDDSAMLLSCTPRESLCGLLESCERVGVVLVGAFAKCLDSSDT